MPKDYILTHSGVRFSLTDPKPNQVVLDDIAYALSHINRFTGHYGQYSVCAHSVNGAYNFEAEGESRLALLFLLHDCMEAYTGDISTPVKNLIKQYSFMYEHMENLIQETIYQALDVAPPTPEEQAAVVHMDRMMLRLEYQRLAPEVGDLVAADYELPPVAPNVVMYKFWEAADFIERFNYLTHKIQEEHFASAIRS